jgi:hypothetical protein
MVKPQPPSQRKQCAKCDAGSRFDRAAMWEVARQKIQ